MKFSGKMMTALLLALCMIAVCLIAAGCAGTEPTDESAAESSAQAESSAESAVSDEQSASADESGEAESEGDSSEAESKETSSEAESKETSKEESKETSKEESKETSKEESKETSKEESKDTSKEESKDTSREESGETSETSGEEPDAFAAAVVGKWKATIDLAPLLQEMAKQGASTSENPQMALILSGFMSKLKGLNLPLYLTLNADGTFLSEVDEEEFKATLSKAYEDYFKETFAFLIKMMGGDLDAYLEQQGLSMDELVDSTLGSMDFSQVRQEGKYHAADGRVYLDGNEEAYAAVEIVSADKLRVTAIEGVQDEQGMLKKILPVTFDRVK
ncbi:MAG: hypothetical protein KBS45_04735 [Clostridiales bacterium]|nr:hypothetical protein [Candidatus Coliplasma caballi]